MLQLVDQTSSLQCREEEGPPSICPEDSPNASGAVPAQSLDCMLENGKAFARSYPAEWADGTQTSSQQECSPTDGSDKAIRANGDSLGLSFAEEWRPELDGLCPNVRKIRTMDSAIGQLQTHTSAKNESIKDYGNRPTNGSRIASNVSTEVTDGVRSEERLGWTCAVTKDSKTKEASTDLSCRPESSSSTSGNTIRADSGERVAGQAPGAQASEMLVGVGPEKEQSWSPEELQQFAKLLLVYGKDWGRISKELPTREPADLEACFMRPCLIKELDEYIESEDSTAPVSSCVSRKRDLDAPNHPYEESSADEKFDKENCDVCRGGASLPGDLIVYCDSCDVGVHQTCYGLRAVPHGEWLCDRCMEGAADKECFLCTQVGGAMKQMDDGPWVHILCAWLDPDVAISNMDAMSAIKRLSLTEDRSQWVCSFCRKHEGFCLLCGWPGCKTTFHVTCCRRKGYLRLGVELGALVIEAYCDRHRKRRAGYKAVIRSMERRCEGNLPLRRNLRKIKSSARAGKLTMQAFTNNILKWAAQLEATKKQPLSDGLKDCSSKSSLKRRLKLLNRIVSRGERASQTPKPSGERAKREQKAPSNKVYISRNQLQDSKLKTKKRKRVESGGTSSKTIPLVTVVQDDVHSKAYSTAKEDAYDTADSKLLRNNDQCQSQDNLIDACDICMNGISMEEDLIVFCDQCDVGVHQSCYGLKVVPSGEWLCRVCESERSATSDNPKAFLEIRCAICLMSGGAMKRMTEESEKQWVHVLCAWVDPDVQIMDTNNMENAKFVHQPSMARKKLVCCFCSHKGGLCIQCMNPECFRPFHPRCARVGGYLRLEMEFGSFVVEAYCDKHRDSRADAMSVLAYLEGHILAAREKALSAEGEEILAELAALKGGVSAGRFTTVEEFETELRPIFELLTLSPSLSGQVGLITIVDEARNRLKRLKSYLSGAYWVGPGKRMSQQTKADARIVSATTKEEEDGDDEGLSSSRCISGVAKEEERKADGIRSPWRKRRARFRDIIMDKHDVKNVDLCSQKMAIDGLATIDCAKTAHPQLSRKVAGEADTSKPMFEDAPACNEREDPTLTVADAVDDENCSGGGTEISLEALPKVAAVARRPPPASTIRRRETLEWMMMLLSVTCMQTSRFSEESIADLAKIRQRARADKCASDRLEALISCAKRGVGPAIGMAWRLLRDYARVLSLQGTISVVALTKALEEEAPDAKVSPSRAEKSGEVMQTDAVWQQQQPDIPVLPTYRLLGARTVWTLQKLFQEEEARRSRIHMKRRLSMVTRGPVGEHGGNVFCHSNSFAVHQVGGRRRYARGIKSAPGAVINKRAGRVRRWHLTPRRSNMLRFQLRTELFFLMHISPSTIASAFAAIPKQKVRQNGKVAKQGQKGMATALIHRMVCGKCTNCCRSDCGSCYSCVNNEHDGRPSARQRCIHRLCLTPLKNKVSRSPTKKPSNGAVTGRVTL